MNNVLSRPLATRASSETQSCRLDSSWRLNQRWPIVLPLLSLAVVTFCFRYSSLDLEISSWFHDSTRQQWPWQAFEPFVFFYQWGILPPLALAAGGMALIFSRPAIDTTGLWRRIGWFLVLLILLGPGVIVNLGFKESWGRPRPHQITRFGGQHKFVPICNVGPIDHNSSFPSGHVAIAFCMIAPAFLSNHFWPRATLGLLCGGLMFGSCMALVRVAQGAHFASDAVWSFGIVYLVAALLARLVLEQPTCLE